jgi:drug/metabolite transporter (DMT)-like permease
MSIYAGEIAALLTALCWSFGAIFYTVAGRYLGSVTINRLRLLVSLIFLAAAHWLLLSTPLPLGVAADRWFWLGLSGIIGLALGDIFLFQAYVWIGPRLAMLLKSLAPVFSALLAWLFLAEALTLGQVVGILLTVGGVSWVVLERNGSGQRYREDGSRYGWGLLLGLGAAVTQAVGLITAKKGLGGDFPALSGHVIRMLVAAVAIWSVTLWQRQARTTIEQLVGQPLAARHFIIGTLLGPVVGVWLSMVAVQRAQVGIASTLMALVPIFMLPIGYFVFKERFGWQAVAGTVVAVVGVGLLFLSPVF